MENRGDGEAKELKLPTLSSSKDLNPECRLAASEHTAAPRYAGSGGLLRVLRYGSDVGSLCVMMPSAGVKT